MSHEEMVKELARVQAENAALKAAQTRAVTFKVSEKGALSVYGLGRFPVTLYQEQWTRLLAQADAITAFIAANQTTLSKKG